jgi:TetR/AcrR family transcriptional repressor of nem operon
MGHSQQKKEENHDRIVRVAGARFREVGVDGLGLADLMKLAGLTHGGFYRHFASREELVGEAIDQVMRDGMAAIDGLLARPGSNLATLVDAYLSPAHRDALASSCGVASLAQDTARSNTRARDAYTQLVEKYLALLNVLLINAPPEARRGQAIAVLSTLVGAVSMARAVNDTALSEEILMRAAEALKASLA